MNFLQKLRYTSRHWMCTLIHGGHELYRQRTDTKFYQQCLLCGYLTEGWEIAPPKRRRVLPGDPARHSLNNRRAKLLPFDREKRA